MAKQIISVFLATMICFSIIPTQALAANDDAVEVNYTTDSVELLSDAPISRGQWIQKLVELFELTLDKTEYPDIYYPDIVDSPFFDSIMIATKYGFIDVEAGENFEPEDFLSREDAVHMLNFYLGIQNGREEYTFVDVENAIYPDDIQVALDYGWAELQGNVFSPAAALTHAEANLMLTKAQEELDKRSVADEVTEYQFADYVKVIPESAEILSSYDMDTEITTLTISGYDGSLVEDDTLVFFSQGFAFVYGVEYVDENDGVWTIVTKEAPDDAIDNYEFVGQMEPELSPYIPENESVTLMSADGEEITFGEIQLLSNDKFKITFARDFSSAGNVGYKGTITGTIKDVTLDSKFVGKQKFFTLSGKIEVTSSMEIDFFNDPAAESLFLGGVHLGPFGYVGVEISLEGEASLGYNYSTSFKIGLDYSGGNPSFIKELNTTQGCFSAEGTVSAKLSLAAQLEFGKVGKAKVGIGTGPVLEGKYKQYAEGTPQKCVTLAGYLYAGIEASVKFKNLFTGDYSLDLEYNWDFYNEMNSPIRVYSHVEDGTPVYACTRSSDQGGTADDGYTVPKYYTPADSQYFATSSSHVSSSGTGSNGEPYVVWSTSENEDGTVTITGYQGNGAILTIPETIDGKTVTVIGSNVFKNNTRLRIVNIPDTITSIGNSAFYGCKNLQMVSLSDTLQSIGDSSFSYCSNLSNLIIPDSVTSIRYYAFSGCISLIEVTLPTRLTYLAGQAFGGCSNLKRVTIPAAITTCYDTNQGGPFANCESLNEIEFAKGIINIPNNLFYSCIGLKDLEIPDTVVTIGEHAFQNTKLKTLTIPDSVTTIDRSAFSGNKDLETIVFSDSVTSISYYAFSDCISLTEVTLPTRLTYLAGQAFGGCSNLKRVTIPATITTCYDTNHGGPFANCESLNEIEFAKGITNIPNNLFYGCTGLKEIEIPNTVTIINENAFRDCTNLEIITLLDGLTTLKNNIFYDCSSLKEIVIPDSVTSMGTYTFYNCSSLVSAKLPASRQNITESMFQNCTSLTDITLPETVTTIQEDAFNNCDALTAIVLPDSVVTVAENAFRDCDALTDIQIGSNVKSIGNYAFYDCDALETIVIPDNVTSLGSYIFAYCDLLKDVDLGYGITTIPTQAFFECPELESIRLPYRVTTINSKAFANCTKLTEATILRNAATINTDAFSYPEILTICGVAGTYAETYADTIGATFEEINLPVTKVTLSDTALEMAKGASHQLTATFDPRYFTDAVTWKSSDTNVVTVSDNGLVKAVGTGTATIKINAGSKGASCKVTVMQPVTSISLNRTSLTLNALGTYKLTATANPSTALNREVSWSSSNPEVATVDQTGFVTAITKGTTTITATAKDGSGVYKSCMVTVTNSAYVAASVTDLESPHNYEDGCTDYWVYTKAGAETLYVTFDARTNVEDGFDFLKIYDGEGTLIDTYTGTELAGATIEVPGDTVRIQIVSDDSGNEWGFKVTSVTSEGAEVIVPVEDAQLSQDGTKIVFTINERADDFTKMLVGIYHPTTGQMLGIGAMEYDSSTGTLTMQLPDGLPGSFVLRIYCTDNDFAPLYESYGFTKDMLM